MTAAGTLEGNYFLTKMFCNSHTHCTGHKGWSVYLQTGNPISGPRHLLPMCLQQYLRFIVSKMCMHKD